MADANFDELRADLMASLGLDVLPKHEESDLADRDWEREWLKDFGPMKFGSRLWICPGDSDVDDAEAVIVRLDPGLAFGTGTHPDNRAVPGVAGRPRPQKLHDAGLRLWLGRTRNRRPAPG